MNAAGMIERLMAYAPVLFNGAIHTALVSAVTILAGFVSGAILLGFSRMGGPMRALVAVYVSFFRGTPLLVQLLMFFYLPGLIGVDPPPLIVAMLTMSLNSAAFQCEILRAGLKGIPSGQIEAAQSFGIPPHLVFRRVQLPQIVRAVGPAVISEAMDVVKNSAIVSTIAVPDLARAGRQIVAANFRPLEVYVTVGIFYLVMTAAVVSVGGRLSGRSPREHGRTRGGAMFFPLFRFFGRSGWTSNS